MPDELRWPQFRNGHSFFGIDKAIEIYNLLASDVSPMLGIQELIFDLWTRDLSEHEKKSLIVSLVEIHAVNKEYADIYSYQVGNKDTTKYSRRSARKNHGLNT